MRAALPRRSPAARRTPLPRLTAHPRSARRGLTISAIIPVHPLLFFGRIFVKYYEVFTFAHWFLTSERLQYIVDNS